jgi:phosphopantothenoylcysteine decarboxylase/phosphopantothenate--cysteine ligase
MLIPPAVNPAWSHPATRANAETLRVRGVVLIGPDEGETAEGELGVGRMVEPEEIVRAAEDLLAGTGPLRGKHVLVSAGGTREPIDAVRYVGNRSSGRMGVALAAEARRRGAHVTLLGANLAVPASPGVELVETPSAADLEREALARAASADVVIMAAAVADYRPAESLLTKRPKDTAVWTVELEPTTDVLAALGESRLPGQLLVGFAADQGDRGLERARDKRTRKHADLFVYNDVGRPGIGFDTADNEVTILSARGERTLAKAPKDEIAAAILDEVEALLG